MPFYMFQKDSKTVRVQNPEKMFLQLKNCKSVKLTVLQFYSFTLLQFYSSKKCRNAFFQVYTFSLEKL